MNRSILVVVALVVFGLAASGATAAIYTQTLPEFNGTWHDVGEPYPLPAVTVGTFAISIPTQEFIISATISGQWGNATTPTTARNELYVDGVLVADTDDYSPDPAYEYYTPWTYSFTDFSVLADGSALFTAVQTSQYVIRLAPTTLTIETNPIPEPCAVAIWSVLGGLGLIVGWRHRRRRAA